MFDYAKSAKTALSLLTKFGATATIRKQTSGAYDPATGGATVTTADYSVKAVLLHYSGNEAAQVNQSETLIELNDRKIIMQATTVSPDVSDLVIFGDTTYRIIRVKTLKPNGSNVVIHEIQARV